MKINQIKRKNKLKKAKLIGRGGKRGKTSGKGHKGQKARSGRKMRPEIRDDIKKIPKMRGRGINVNKSRHTPFAAVGLSLIEEKFETNETVSPKNLFEKRMIRKANGKLPKVKITSGDLKKSLIFSKVSFTQKSLEIIKKTNSKLK